MSLATIHCRAAVGIQAPAVTVEVHLANGLPAFNIVGLPEKAVQESRERVRSALLNAGCEFPARRITCNLAPADLPKEGSRFDLAIAVGILAASGQMPGDSLDGLEFLGELNLAGEIRPVRGLLPAALAGRERGRALVFPEANRDEAGLVGGLRAYPAGHLLEVLGHCDGSSPLPALKPVSPERFDEPGPDLAEVIGQAHAKRALEIAAAGAHNLLFIGPPGTGKSMLAARLPGILPAMDETEALETAAVKSVASADGRRLDPRRWRRRPFRSPHHTASGVALVGGGGSPRPGEISLAHNGVLFLDELPEFDRRVLEVLREPLESGRIVISRAARQAEFPARFQLIAAMNPCPCGHLGDTRRSCRCTSEQVARYRARISGPLLDRIDLHVEVPAVPVEQLHAGADGEPGGEPSRRVRERVERARQLQSERQGGANATLAEGVLRRHCALDAAARALLGRAGQRLALSARGHHRILRVARTIADLDGCETIRTDHLGEAIGYRSLDRREP